jgi:hypothetical protein
MQMTNFARKPVHAEQKNADLSVERIKQLTREDYSYQAMADVLNREGYRTLRGKEWNANNIRQVVFKLRRHMPSWYGLSATRANYSPSIIT